VSKYRAFFLVCGLLSVCLIGWEAYSITTHPVFVGNVDPGGFQPRGISNMPDKAMEGAIIEATRVMKSNYHSYHVYRWWSRCADWIGFFLTAAITVIVGSTGRTLQPSATPPAGLPVGTVPVNATDLGRKWVQCIGVMAALASVLIAVSSRVAGASQERLDGAEKLRGAITNSRIAYAGAATAAEAQKIVDDLVAETEKQR
jgi:hypothetical protein